MESRSDDELDRTRITSDVETSVNVLADSTKHPLARLSDAVLSFLADNGEVSYLGMYEWHFG